MRPNFNLMKATLTGALGGLLFGFDTVVISGAIDALVKLYGLSARGEGFTVAIGLVGTVIGALGAGVAGQRLGGREALRLTALLYIVSAFGCGGGGCAVWAALGRWCWLVRAGGGVALCFVLGAFLYCCVAYGPFFSCST